MIAELSEAGAENLHQVGCTMHHGAIMYKRLYSRFTNSKEGAKYGIKSDNSVAKILNGLKLLFGNRQVSAHSRSDLRAELYRQIELDYGPRRSSNLFLTDIGSRHGVAAVNAQNFLIFETSIVPVLQKHESSNDYAKNILLELSAETRFELKLFLGSITLTYRIINNFIWATEGLALTYLQIKKEYEKTQIILEDIIGQKRANIIKRLLENTSHEKNEEFVAFWNVYKNLFKSSPRKSIDAAESEIFISVSRAHEKVSLELKKFLELDLSNEDVLSVDNRISERAFALVKNTEFRNTAISNQNLWSISLAKLSGTTSWLKKQLKSNKEDLIIEMLHSRNKANTDAEKRNENLNNINVIERGEIEEEDCD